MHSVCVKDKYINIIHYTPLRGKRILHGHTLRVQVCIKGDLANGYVIDFLILNDIVEDILNKLNNALLIPVGHSGKVSFRAPIDVEVKYYYIDHNEASLENIAKHIADQLSKSVMSKHLKLRNVREVFVEVEDVEGFKASYTKPVNIS